jgi:hypothetical protein
MAAGATATDPLFNWFEEGGDAEDARHFIASLGGDELGNRRLATLKAYGLLRTRYAALEELAEKLEKDTTLLGEDVARICLADAARRSARSIAATMPRPKPTKPPRRPRGPAKGSVERQPFKLTVEKTGDAR